MTCKLCPARKHCWDKGACENCDFGKAYENLNKKVKRLEAKNQQIKWISVEERLPEEKEIERSFFDHETLALLGVEPQLYSDEVLVVVRVIEENHAFVATDCTKEGKWLNWQYGDYEVTHWMPLPEAPKMKGGAEE